MAGVFLNAVVAGYNGHDAEAEATYILAINRATELAIGRTYISDCKQEYATLLGSRGRMEESKCHRRD